MLLSKCKTGRAAPAWCIPILSRPNAHPRSTLPPIPPAPPLLPQNGQAKPTLLSKCKTGSDGTCTVRPNIPKASRGQYLGWTLVGVARSGADVAVVPAVSWSQVYGSPAYVGAVVLDRALVKPGDKLHVTGKISATSVLRCTSQVCVP